MNRKRARELLPIIQGFSEGGLLQAKYTDDDVWTTVADAEWLDYAEYRIKPEPRDFWIFPMGGDNYEACEDKDRAKGYIGVIHVREVIEND